MSQLTKTPPTEPGWYWIDETVRMEGSVDLLGQPITRTTFAPRSRGGQVTTPVEKPRSGKPGPKRK